MCGVNAWRLMTWMGHKRIEETQLYIHFGEAHRRPIPPVLVAAGARELDPDRRVLAMLSGRCPLVASASEGNEKAVGCSVVR
jgi:hypothetical protein